MSSETESPAVVRQSPQEDLVGDLKRYGAALLPGAAEVLAQRNASLVHLSSEKRAERIAELMESPAWAAFRNPEFVPGKLENGAAPSPLRAALARHSGDLKPDAVDALASSLAASTIGKSPAQVAGLVVSWLGSREAREYLACPPALPERETRISSLVYRHFEDVMGSAAAARLAAERARDWQHMSERDVVAAIANILRSPQGVSRYGAKAVLPDGDPRLKTNISLSHERPRYGPAPAQAGPARAANGTFSQAPPKRRPTSSF